MGVFVGWLGFACLRLGCVRFLVFAFLGVGACGVGWWGSVVPPPLALPFLLACLRSGVGVVGVCDAPLRAGCNSVGRDKRLSRPV